MRRHSVLHLVIVKASSVIQRVASIRSISVSLVLVLVKLSLISPLSAWLDGRGLIVQKSLALKEVLSSIFTHIWGFRFQVLLKELYQVN